MPNSAQTKLLKTTHFSLANKTNRSFQALSLSLFNYQYNHNRFYQNYCDSLGAIPDSISKWQDIPALPTDVFKLVNTPVTCFAKEETKHTFTTSGTTSEVKGQHHFPSLSNYETSIIKSWEEHALPKPQHLIILTPSPSEAPHSSLSHMMGVLSDQYAEQTIWAIKPDGAIDLPSIIKLASGHLPVSILGTALAFLHLFEQLPHNIPLPKGSWAMETGGYKGTNRQLEKKELYSMFQQSLGLPADQVINEYSMTELSSQFYTRGLDRPHTVPSWVRIRVIDPRTNLDAEPNQPGHLHIYDTANIHSVMAIKTQDMAIAHDDRTFTLLGRDPSALPRGCSRAADNQIRS